MQGSIEHVQEAEGILLDCVNVKGCEVPAGDDTRRVDWGFQQAMDSLTISFFSTQ